MSLLFQHIRSCLKCIPIGNNVFTFTVKVKEKLNVHFVVWLVNGSAVITWLQHRVLATDKHGVHFPVLEGILNFLTLPFSICVSPIISVRFLFLLNAVNWFSWNKPQRFFLVWRMFQFLWTAAVRCTKNQLYVNINAVRFGSCCSWSFSCSSSSLTSLSIFFNCSSTSFWS